MYCDSSTALPRLPHVYKGICTSTVACVIISIGCTSEGSLIGDATEYTFVAFEGVRVPELDVFGANSYELVTGEGKTNIEDAVRVSLLRAALT